MDGGPADEVRAAERALRECITWVLSNQYGRNWLSQTGLKSERIQELEARRIEEGKRRPTVAPSDNLLDYTELHELQDIITHNTRWHLFKGIFYDRKRFQVWMECLASYRNPTMHSRDLVPHEQMLLRGVAGEVRALVTKARVDADELDHHFARIESVRDSFGYVATENTERVRTGVVVRPGDMVAFSCEGFDPTGANLDWWWDDGHEPSSLEYVADSSVIEWHVEERHVAGRFYFSIFLLADRPYHRHGWHDGHVAFEYRVLPQNDEGPAEFE